MRPIFLIIIAVLLTVVWQVGGISAPAGAQWHAAGTMAPAEFSVTLSEPDPATITLEISVPGCFIENVLVAGRSHSQVTAPGLQLLQVMGYPELPILTRTVRIPATGQASLEILRTRVREVAVAPVIPSKGHLSRNTDPDTVPYTWAEMYAAGGIFPEAIAELTEPFLLRDQRGVTIRVHPLRYDAARGVLRILEDLTLRVTTTGSGGINEVAPGEPERAFAALYSQVFANATVSAQVLTKGLGAAPEATSVVTNSSAGERMLIVCHDDFIAALDPFVNWKQQRGIAVEVAPASVVAPNAAELQRAIQERYESDLGLTYVILVGDLEQVPTCIGIAEGAVSDATYDDAAATEIYTDLFVSRISAQTLRQVQTQVAKFVRYERDPDLGSASAWYSRAAGVASDEGAPADFERANGLRDDLLGYHFSEVDRIYQGFGGTTAAVGAALITGRSLVNYIGHGTGYGWTSVPFSNADVRTLDNGWQQPWIVDVACLNGDFSLSECFAEAWLRAGSPEQPSGAIAVCAASALAPWIPPTVMQAGMMDALVSDGENCLGALFAHGMARVLDSYAGLSVARATFEQFNLFGDCSLQVRTATPVVLAVSHPESLSIDAASLSIALPTGLHCTVALTRDGEMLATAVASAGGDLDLVLPEALVAGGAVRLTVTAYNTIPYQVELVVAAAPGGTEPGSDGPDDGEDGGEGDADAQADPTLPTVVTLFGNYPNPFNPRTTIAYALPAATTVVLDIYDARGQLLRRLVHGHQAAGRHEVSWDGCDARGGAVPTGVYFHRLQAGATVVAGKMLLVR